MLKKKSKNPKNCLKITKNSLFFPTFLKKPFLDWDSFLNQAFLNWECTVPDFTDNIQIRLATILFVAPWPCKIRMQQKECNGTNLIFIIWWNYGIIKFEFKTISVSCLEVKLSGPIFWAWNSTTDVAILT